MGQVEEVLTELEVEVHQQTTDEAYQLVKEDSELPIDVLLLSHVSLLYCLS